MASMLREKGDKYDVTQEKRYTGTFERVTAVRYVSLKLNVGREIPLSA